MKLGESLPRIIAATLALGIAACADVPDELALEGSDDGVDVVSQEAAIINGSAAGDAARAVQAALLAPQGTGVAVFCGGVYLGTDPQGRPWAATAAHCVDALATNHRFGFGGLNVSAYTTANTVGWVEAVRHPAWNAQTIVNDIAVVRLAAVPSDATPVTLADATTDAAAGETVTISGYGYTQQPSLWCLYFGISCPATTNTLREASPSVLTTAACVQTFSGVDDRQICVRDPAGTRGACNGDSGGPMFRATGTVVGVTSYGRGGCSPANPQVYTRISAFRSWIAETTGI